MKKVCLYTLECVAIAAEFTSIFGTYMVLKMIGGTHHDVLYDYMEDQTRSLEDHLEIWSEIKAH